VKEARIVRNPRSGESRGFGFLIMENDDDVDRVSQPCITLLFRPTFSSFAGSESLLYSYVSVMNLQAIRHLDGRDWNGRRLLVERAKNVK